MELPIFTPQVGLDSFQDNRRKTRRVMVGNIAVGDGAPISVQTMTKTKTGDAAATIAQIKRCEEAGVDIVRVTLGEA